MKNAIILHGTSANPKSFWFPYLKKQLEKKGYEVSVPALPTPATLENRLPVVLSQTITRDIVLVSHSSGGPLILSLLENININIKIKQAILVAGFARILKNAPQSQYIVHKQYNWQKIKANVEEIIFINSDNDPYGCNDKEGRYMFDKLGGTLIIKKGEGHLGSFNAPYKEFPLLVKLID